jgi:hypothetical protein
MSIKQTIGDNISSGGSSLDQVIASQIGHETLFPSLEYGLDRITTESISMWDLPGYMVQVFPGRRLHNHVKRD